jgi:hypothetical protein
VDRTRIGAVAHHRACVALVAQSHAAPLILIIESVARNCSIKKVIAGVAVTFLQTLFHKLYA